METQTFDGKALPYVLMTPTGAADAGYPLVILLHGFGASMYDLAGLAPTIDGEGYVYAFPNAPFVMNFGPGQMGYSWFANRPGVELPKEPLPPLEELLDTFVGEVSQQTGAAPGSIILGGFSQGGGVTLHHGLPRPETFAGLAVLSGAFRDHDDVKGRLPAERRQPIFVGHGTFDSLISLDQAHATKAFLEDAGYAPVYKEYEMAHEISMPEIHDLTTWLHETLPSNK